MKKRLDKLVQKEEREYYKRPRENGRREGGEAGSDADDGLQGYRQNLGTYTRNEYAHKEGGRIRAGSRPLEGERKQNATADGGATADKIEGDSRCRPAGERPHAVFWGPFDAIRLDTRNKGCDDIWSRQPCHKVACDCISAVSAWQRTHQAIKSSNQHAPNMKPIHHSQTAYPRRQTNNSDSNQE